MKLLFIAILFSFSCLLSNSYPILITQSPLRTAQSFDITDSANWQWCSGNLAPAAVGVENDFVLNFNPRYYKPGDEVRVTFHSFAVSLKDLCPGAIFSTWHGEMKMVYVNEGHYWIPVDLSYSKNPPKEEYGGPGGNNLSDTGKHASLLSDSVSNVDISVIVPSTMQLMLSAEAGDISTTDLSCVYNEPGKNYFTLCACIKGIKCKKKR